MKSQYVGDIGDFGKVLLLKHLSALGFRIGVNWVLTDNDDRADGKHRDYIDYRSKDCLCCCDDGIFELMIPLAKKKKNDRRIEDLEVLIRGFSDRVTFYSEKYVNGKARANSKIKAFAHLSPRAADLVFFDPDNGFGGDEGTSSKHVYMSDLNCYWKRRQSLLTYHHLGRIGTHDQQVEQIESEFRKAFPDGGVSTLHLRRGTARVYILCLRKEHLSKVRGDASIPAIEPLRKTKGEWAKLGQNCAKRHSV